jgi:NAD(P) transhydrogenase subunit alpha
MMELPISILLLSFFLGYYVTLRTSSSLHAPLMSLTNGVSGVIVVFAFDFINTHWGHCNVWEMMLSFSVIFILSLNIVGGLLMTQRMLAFFQPKKT